MSSTSKAENLLFSGGKSQRGNTISQQGNAISQQGNTISQQQVTITINKWLCALNINGRTSHWGKEGLLSTRPFLFGY